MTKKEYNGWTNYETWNVKLWMDNEEGSQRYVREKANEVWNRAKETEILSKSESARADLADSLKDEYENDMQDLLESTKRKASVWNDLLGAALSEVNWFEIADSLLTDSGCEGYEPHKEAVTE